MASNSEEKENYEEINANRESNSLSWKFEFSSAHVVILIFAVVVSWWIGHSRILIRFVSKTAHEDSLRRSPYIDSKNASTILRNRFNFIQNDFENSMNRNDWSILRKSKNISVEVLDSSDGWPPYIRTTAFLPFSPAEVFDIFKWSSFDKTQKAIDPFYHSSSSILELGKGWRIIRKLTKRPLMFARREFFLGTYDTKIQKPFLINKPLSEQDLDSDASSKKMEIGKGTLMSVLVSVRPVEDLLPLSRHKEANTEGAFVQSYQDFIGYFIPVPGGTKLNIIMRVDLGDDIPRWIFMAVVSATGIRAVTSMLKYLHSLK